MTPIGVHLHLLQASDVTDAQSRSLDVIARNVRRLQEHVEDVATAVRMHAGEIRAESSDVRLAALVQGAFAREEAAAREAGVTLSATGEALAAHADPVVVGDVLVHLLRHAVRATPAGGAVVVDATRDGMDVTLRVLDGGNSVPSAQRTGMFRLDGVDVASRGPAGFDLYLAAGLAKITGGRVFHEATGEGTLIGLELPVGGAAPEDELASRGGKR